MSEQYAKHKGLAVLFGGKLHPLLCSYHTTSSTIRTVVVLDALPGWGLKLNNSKRSGRQQGPTGKFLKNHKSTQRT